MADEERDLVDCVGAVYEAATGNERWLDVGVRLRRLFDAQSAVFRVEEEGRGSRDLLSPPTAAEALYGAYFHRVDPYRIQARRDFATDRLHHIGMAKLGPELVPQHQYLRSEYYADFARKVGRHHMIGGMIGVRAPTPLALYRDREAEAFDGGDLRRLEILLPHLQRAVELQVRLGRQAEDGLNSRAAADAVSAGLVLVDAGLGVRFANAAATALLGRPKAPAVLAHAGPRLDGGTYLSPRCREDAARLRRLVGSVTAGGAGGSFRLRADEFQGDPAPSVVVMVAPAPARLALEAGAGVEPLILIVLRDMARHPAPPPEMLCDIFGLSPAEAEVAVALMGGVSAEQVAEHRAVALGTVRSQVRAILEKSGAANLRDLERSLAALGTMALRSEG